MFLVFFQNHAFKTSGSSKRKCQSKTLGLSQRIQTSALQFMISMIFVMNSTDMKCFIYVDMQHRVFAIGDIANIRKNI